MCLCPADFWEKKQENSQKAHIHAEIHIFKISTMDFFHYGLWTKSNASSFRFYRFFKNAVYTHTIRVLLVQLHSDLSDRKSQSKSKNNIRNRSQPMNVTLTEPRRTTKLAGLSLKCQFPEYPQSNLQTTVSFYGETSETRTETNKLK